MERDLVGVNIAVLAVSDAPEDPSAKLIVERLGAIGHKILAHKTVQDSEKAIRGQLLDWMADPQIEVVIATAGIETVSAGHALATLVTRPLPGFADLFRLLTYEEIGAAAMLVDAEAARCGATYVFVLPASMGAVRTALDKILIPQLDHRTKPRNLASRLPRIRGATSDKPALTQPPTQPPLPPTGPATPPRESTAMGPPPAPPRQVTLPIRKPPPSPPAKPPTQPLPKPASEAKPDPAPPIPPPPAKPLNLQALPSVMVDESLAVAASDLLEVDPVASPARFEPAPPPPSFALDPAPPDVPVFPRREPARKRFVLWGGFVLAFSTMVVVAFLMLRDHDRTAAADDGHPDRAAARKPRAVIPEPKPPEPKPPEVAPQPELVIEDPPPAPVPQPAPHPRAPTRIAARPPAPSPVKASAPEPPPPPAPVQPAPEDGCDEVSCVLDHYRLGCCERFKPKAVEPKLGLADELDRAMVKAGIAKVMPVVIACGEKSAAKGTVKVAIEVGGDGHVTDATVVDSPDEPLGACVAKAVRRATFAKTTTGGSFKYPFLF